MEQFVDNNVLPPDFDGVFRFTNFSDTDFTAKWGGIAYTFPSQKMTPMVIPSATPEEVQHIRKKFAKELATREFYNTDKFKGMNTSHLDKTGQPTGGTPATYTDSDLTGFIQRCLEPLPIAQAKVEVMPKDNENKYRKDNKGRNVTKVLEKDESLIANEGTMM